MYKRKLRKLLMFKTLIKTPSKLINQMIGIKLFKSLHSKSRHKGRILSKIRKSGVKYNKYRIRGNKKLLINKNKILI